MNMCEGERKDYGEAHRQQGHLISLITNFRGTHNHRQQGDLISLITNIMERDTQTAR
jgi:hypothetical protein